MKPTPKQLRTLADRAGQTFTYPPTAAQASAEIQRLQGQTPTPPADRHREKRALERDMATGRGDAAQVRDAETTGYGSSAHWAHNDDQAVDEPTTTVKRAGPRTKLATYTAGGQARVLVGQRIAGEPWPHRHARRRPRPRVPRRAQRALQGRAQGDRRRLPRAKRPTRRATRSSPAARGR